MKEEKETNRLHNRNFFDAWKNAINGVKCTFKTQVNINIQLVIAVITIILGFVCKFNITEWMCLFFAIFIVIITEMVNTAIETVVDLCTEEYNEKAKIAKDVAAGAVVLSAINSIIIGYFLFGTRIVEIIINRV